MKKKINWKARALESEQDHDIIRFEFERPIPIILFCPMCGLRHIDVGEFSEKPHHTHACQGCGFVWRPSTRFTVGVQFLPDFKDDPEAIKRWEKAQKVPL